MLDFCKTNIPAIEFIYISKERMGDVRLDLKERFALGQTIPGIRSYHFFKPVSSNVVSYKRTAEDDAFGGLFNITGEPDFDGMRTESVRLNDYVACRCDDKWWIGVVEEVDRVERDVKINFLHPSGPASFRWPRKPDVCWVAITDVICHIQAPVTATGRTYKIDEQDSRNINARLSMN